MHSHRNRHRHRSGGSQKSTKKSRVSAEGVGFTLAITTCRLAPRFYSKGWEADQFESRLEALDAALRRKNMYAPLAADASVSQATVDIMHQLNASLLDSLSAPCAYGYGYGNGDENGGYGHRQFVVEESFLSNLSSEDPEPVGYELEDIDDIGTRDKDREAEKMRETDWLEQLEKMRDKMNQGDLRHIDANGKLGPYGEKNLIEIVVLDSGCDSRLLHP
ncbi:hypothetical protein B0H67DRAFT_686792 [Lasiosphaeris hirsuta]|uniref:Uncharacterized protein n=1 Tax=Lasiosphaeris hirsuta TaxID=260670 RepID=A0AA39ZVC1_9PEZI|nr:hypothetical protein B0H67DRAFT_686792 [Lasiosphaeris hirsuta]